MQLWVEFASAFEAILKSISLRLLANLVRERPDSDLGPVILLCCTTHLLLC
jgi:hypothetical protein